MPDIAMCKGEECPMKQDCYRCTAKASELQSYFMVPPIKEDNTCDYFMEIWNKPKQEDDGKNN